MAIPHLDGATEAQRAEPNLYRRKFRRRTTADASVIFIPTTNGFRLQDDVVDHPDVPSGLRLRKLILFNTILMRFWGRLSNVCCHP